MSWERKRDWCFDWWGKGKVSLVRGKAISLGMGKKKVPQSIGGRVPFIKPEGN